MASACCMIFSMRICLLLCLCLCMASPALAQAVVFPAPSGKADAQTLVVYSSLDEPLATPMIEGFQKANPDIAVHYEDMLTGEIYDRIVKETDAGKKTADFAFSSAMDLQVKLSNDGYAQRSDLAMSARWPAWANWRNTAYALTFEPAVFVYHKPSFTTEKPPATRAEFVDYLERHAKEVHGRIATYDIERSGVGFLFMSRDQEQFGDIWSVIKAMGAAGVKVYSTSSAILERVSDGRFVMGYNILGSYAADWASRHPDVGIVLPKDYTVVMSRIGLVPEAAANPALGRRYLGNSIAQNLALSNVEGNHSPFDTLSPRELEVALLLTQGLRQEDIAKRLSLSAKTVNTHKARLFEKMGINDNIALARMASQYGLVDPARPM